MAYVICSVVERAASDQAVICNNRILDNLDRGSGMDNRLTLPAIALSILILLASVLYLLLRPRKSSGPVIFLIGPSGSGKTSLFSYVRLLTKCNVDFMYS